MRGMAQTGTTGQATGTVAASLAALVGLWIGAAALTADATVLPQPWQVLAVFHDELVNGPMAGHLWSTLRRVALAFAIAMVAGTVLGYLLGRSARLDRWLNPWVVVFLNVPALVVIVLAYLWIGLNEVAAIVAVSVNKTAMVLVNMREGTRMLSRPLADMAQVFAMPRGRVLRHVVLPQLAPYLAASARNGLSVIWKIVLVVEFLGRPNGIGFQIHLYFQLFDTAHVLAYALSFVAVMVVIEYALLRPLDRRAGRWQVA